MPLAAFFAWPSAFSLPARQVASGNDWARPTWWALTHQHARLFQPLLASALANIAHKSELFR
eukprot:885952-Alexandrium_andersonii.AAC.1